MAHTALTQFFATKSKTRPSAAVIYFAWDTGRGRPVWSALTVAELHADWKGKRERVPRGGTPVMHLKMGCHAIPDDALTGVTFRDVMEAITEIWYTA